MSNTQQNQTNYEEPVIVEMFRCPVCNLSVQRKARSAHYQRHVCRGEMAQQRDARTGEVTYLYQATALLAALPEVAR